MIYGSVCSGIEAATAAWHPLGWRPAFFSEIEPFPKRVLAHRWPGIPDLGDFTAIKDHHCEPIDLLVGGTPCQSFSVAGLRKGLDDPRGNLMLEFGALARRLDARWVVWENVPGVLSSNGGRDFGAFLGMLGELGYGYAYRVLDAQFFGVAQRRRRVFVVGHAGGLWQRAAAVLFEPESLRGDPAPRREAGERPSGTIASRTRGGGGLGADHEPDGGPVAHALTGNGFDASEDGTGRGTPLVPCGSAGERARALTTSGGTRCDMESETFVAVDYTNGLLGEVAGTLEAAQAKGNRGLGALVPVGVTLHGSDGTVSTAEFTETAGALRSRAPGGIENSSTTAVLDLIPFDPIQITSKANRSTCAPGAPMHTLPAAPAAPAVAFTVAPSLTATNDPSRSPQSEEVTRQVAAVLAAEQERHPATAFPWQLGGTMQMSVDVERCGSLVKNQVHAVHAVHAVRRLTPRECERLQGFPDDYTAIPGAADGPRYRALGNSMAVPVMRWIGARIQAVDDAVKAHTEAA